VCLLDFYITQILTSTTVITECISWLIKVTRSGVLELLLVESLKGGDGVGEG
jgi:hypothetical protein